MDGMTESGRAKAAPSIIEMESQAVPENHRRDGEPRFRYDSDAKTVTAGKQVWPLKDIPVHVMFEWIREGRVIKGVLEDWLEQQVFWRRHS